jgi:hypothetical protein
MSPGRCLQVLCFRLPPAGMGIAQQEAQSGVL